MDFFERKLDDKNRLTVPKELRDEFENSKVIITPGLGKDLHMYPEKVWNTEVEAALRGQGWSNREKPVALDEEIRGINLKLRRGMVRTNLDSKQGRITLEPHLMRHAGIYTTVIATRVPLENGSYWVLESPEAA